MNPCAFANSLKGSLSWFSNPHLIYVNNKTGEKGDGVVLQLVICTIHVHILPNFNNSQSRICLMASDQYGMKFRKEHKGGVFLINFNSIAKIL